MFNEDWYSEPQLKDLCSTYSRVANLEGAIIEIGCWEGRSAHQLARACYPETLLCNDTWKGNVEESKVTGLKHPTETILETRDVYAIFLSNMDSLTQGNYKVVKEDCLQWLADLPAGFKIKFCHVDASHEYGSVKRTIELLLPHLVDNGILCGDDYQTAHLGREDLQGGVQRAVCELLPNHQNIHNFWIWQKC